MAQTIEHIWDSIDLFAWQGIKQDKIKAAFIKAGYDPSNEEFIKNEVSCKIYLANNTEYYYVGDKIIIAIQSTPTWKT